MTKTKKRTVGKHPALAALYGHGENCNYVAPLSNELNLHPDVEHAGDLTKLAAKDTNPKDAVGTKKWRVYSTVPMTVIWELGVAMLEGARKYGRHNYRVAGVRASVYVDAAKGHIDSWWEGEDIDADSGLSHITKAIASLAVMRDAMIQKKFVDDRPPHTDLAAFREGLQKVVDDIFARLPNAVPAYVEGDQYEKRSFTSEDFRAIGNGADVPGTKRTRH